MLENLSSIDWSKLTHAYGEADDIPQLLRNLISHDEEIRRDALGLLDINICHQGTVYEASAYTVPFLLELVQLEKTQDRENLLLLLSHLACGKSYHRQHLQFSSDEQKHDPAIQKEVEEQDFWTDRTHQMVKEGIPLYMELVNHQEVKIRMNAIYLLSHFSSEAAQLIPRLSTCFQYERDQRGYACLIYSVSVLIRDQSEDYLDILHLIEQSLDEGESDLICVAAAMALIRTGSQNLPARVLDVLLEAILHPETIEHIYEELPWAKSYLPIDVAISLSQLPATFTHSLVNPRLIEFLEMVRVQDEQILKQISLSLIMDLHRAHTPVDSFCE